MLNLLFETGWSPYLAGAGIGILLWCSFLFSNKPLGCSTAFSRTSGMIESIFCPDKVKDKEYYKMFVPEIEWQWMMVFGIILGACISSVLSGSFQISFIPQTFQAAFGDNILLRFLMALVGGIMMGLGARWSWGCTSGHGISGMSQLSLASLVAVMGFFVAGIGTAMILYSW